MSVTERMCRLYIVLGEIGEAPVDCQILNNILGRNGIVLLLVTPLLTVS